MGLGVTLDLRDFVERLPPHPSLGIVATLRCMCAPLGCGVHSKPMNAAKRPGSLYLSAAAVMRFHMFAESVVCSFSGSWSVKSTTIHSS